MGNQEFKALLQKYQAGTCSDEERALLEAWYMNFEIPNQEKLTEQQLDGILAMQVPVQSPPRQKLLWKWVSVAASLFIVATIGIYFSIKQSQAPQEATVHFKTDIAPGTNKAVLTLANGQKIILNEAKTGILTNEADVDIRKSEDGKISYDANHSGTATAVAFNTMSTPRGGQYQLTLADGTKVWLNAASSITYPTRFVGKQRKVEVTGEAYFEVAHMTHQPFHVVSRGQDIEVLGTHFNVNAYADQSVIKTTLLQGSVKVTNLATQNAKLIVPGQQSIFSSSGIAVVAADVEQVMAWREGKFRFGENADIRAVMTEIARWYDIDVEYKGTINKHFGGSISRQVPISKVLTLLQTTGGVKFDIVQGDAFGKGRRVIVMP
ncbi:MAG: FecR domain-containing protein [Pedobacter sp.]|nr:FecR domain-containing protein [Pedobacter sp.]MDQ8052274.1 FecR domain-containing protein [Pedobacter sp.]